MGISYTLVLSWWSHEGSSDYNSRPFIVVGNIYGVVGMIVAVPTYSIPQRNIQIPSPTL